MAKLAEFESAVLPQVASLVRVARRLTLNTDTADDLVQETLLLAWRGFHQFHQGSNLRAWLFRILMNAHHGRGRKLRRLPILTPLSEGEAQESLLPAESPRIVDAIGVRQALNRLSDDHRAVLMLGVVEGLSCKEMSQVLGVPMGTVMSRISRARDALREELELAPAERETAAPAGGPLSRLGRQEV